MPQSKLNYTRVHASIDAPILSLTKPHTVKITFEEIVEMDIIFFDEILETHTCESLKSALINRGHKVYWTGKIWQGHQFPADEVDTNFIWEKVKNLIEQKPDVIFNFRASSLLPEMIIKLKNSGINTIVWLPDDPVLYHICYRHIVEFYDTILHCGDAHILNFYEEKHGRSGFNFPFWTDASFFPFSYNPENAEYDLVFLGNCVGQVKRERYKLIASLPGKKRIFGKVSNDEFNLGAGFIKDTKEISRCLGKGLIGLNIPQYFKDYGSTDYDFPQLKDLGFFQYPSRIIQYAACGLPIISLQPGNSPATFPELITVSDINMLINKINILINNPEYLSEILSSHQVYQRFRQNFSAESRAIFLEKIIANEYVNLDTVTRSQLFGQVMKTESQVSTISSPTGEILTKFNMNSSESNLPSVEEQRENLRNLNLESPRKFIILYFGHFANGDTDIVACLLRSLRNLGHIAVEA